MHEDLQCLLKTHRQQIFTRAGLSDLQLRLAPTPCKDIEELCSIDKEVHNAYFGHSRQSFVMQRRRACAALAPILSVLLGLSLVKGDVKFFHLSSRLLSNGKISICLSAPMACSKNEFLEHAAPLTVLSQATIDLSCRLKGTAYLCSCLVIPGCASDACLSGACRQLKSTAPYSWAMR